MKVKLQPYLLDEFVSISAHIVHSVPVYSEVSLERLMLLQQALRQETVNTKRKNWEEFVEAPSELWDRAAYCSTFVYYKCKYIIWVVFHYCKMPPEYSDILPVTAYCFSCTI